MIELVFGAAMLAGCTAAGGWYARSWLAVRSAGAPLGLACDPTLTLSGEVDGFGVRYLMAESQPPCHTLIQLGFRLPGNILVSNQSSLGRSLTDLLGERDVQLGNDLDPVLRVRGPLPEVRQLLLDPRVEAAVRAVVEVDGQLVLHPDRLVVMHRGTRLDGLTEKVQRGVDLARALRDCWELPWSELAAHHALRDEGTADLRRLAGNAQGVPIVVQQHRRTRSRTTLRVTAQLRQPLPADTVLSHPDRARGRSVELADPILGGKIHAVSSDPVGLGARLCRDSVRGPLLEVVRGHPGSTVTTDRIGLLVPDSPMDPRPFVELVLELERSLAELGLAEVGP